MKEVADFLGATILERLIHPSFDYCNARQEEHVREPPQDIA
jgi:hypothetical protein